MAVKFLSDGHFSGSSTDLTLDGQLFLPSYTSSPAAPTISFDSNAGGIWYDSNDDQIWFRAGNSNRAYINSSGVVSQANVYTGTSGQFRNYAGVWKGTTGQTGNGFEFINSVDGTALTLSSTGDAVFAGDITSVGLTVDYTGNRTGDAGILVTNDGGDWGVKVDKDGTSDFGILSQTDGDNAIVVRNAAGTTNIQLQGDGDATFVGDVTAASFVKSGGTSSQFLMADGSVSTGGSGISQADADVRYVRRTGGSSSAMSGDLHIISGGPKIYLQDNTDDDDQAIIFRNNGGSDEYKIATQDFTTGGGGDGFYIGSTTSDGEVAIVTNNTTAAVFHTNQDVTINGLIYQTDTQGDNSFVGNILLQNAGTPQLRIYRTNGANTKYGVTSSDIGEIGTTTNHSFRLIQNSGAALTIDTSKNATFAADLTVTGGDITLGGTGRIQGIDTVSAGTDAVNKTYVDNAISGITEQDTLDTVADRGSITDNTITVNGLRTNADSTYDLGQNGTRFSTAFVDNIQLRDKIKNNTAAYINYISNQGHRFFVDSNGDDTAHQFQILANTDTYAAGNVVFKVEQTGDTSIYGDIIGSGNLFLRSYNDSGEGIFFRDGFEYGDSNPYNLSITILNDGDGSSDALEINAYDGIYFNTGSGTQNIRAVIDSSGDADFYGNVEMQSGNAVGKFAVMSNAPHGSYDFYNNGTSYFNGGVIVDDHLQVTGGSAQLTVAGSVNMNQSNTQVTMSGNTSGNFTLDNNTGSIAFQANGSTVNSMTITSSAITLNENTTVTGTFDPQGNILGAVIDDGNSANPLQVRRSAASTMQVGINFTVSPSSGSGFSRYLGVDSSADLRFGSNTNHGANALVLTTANYVSQFGSFAGDIVPSADSTYDLGSNATKWAEGHFDHLYVGETGNNPRIDIYTENATASIADTFADTTTDKSYIYFNAGTNSNDPGYIMHETSENASPDERNEGVLHLVPSDDNASTDYVSIHGTNDPDAIKLYTNGLIETANYQLVLRSAVGDVYIDDGLTVNGTIAATGGTSTTWNEAHDNMIISASVSGTSTKTLTLNQNDGGTITASWSDLQGTTVSAPNAPTNLSLSIVNNTINVTFDASSTSGIDQYLVFGSANGGDYSLISVIEPASMGSTMSVIDDSFDDSGTQAYRVYAMKTGVMSSALSGSVTYTVSTPVEPTNMSVVNLNTAFYIQWDPPSSNARFVTAYNVYKHEHASQGSLSRSSATLIYSGMNTSYMYEISGNNNLNYHQFWVETTVT